MLVIDANIVLEVLYRRSRWKESKELLDRIKRGELSACMLQFAVHGISVMLGKPELVSTFLREILSWRGLEVRDLSVEEEVVAAELARGWPRLRRLSSLLLGQEGRSSYREL